MSIFMKYNQAYCEMNSNHYSPSLSLVLLDSEGCGDKAWTGPESLDLESLFRRVGGPVGVRAGFWMGGGLADVGWGDGGRLFIAPGDGGRVLEFCLKEEIESCLCFTMKSEWKAASSDKLQIPKAALKKACSLTWKLLGKGSFLGMESGLGMVNGCVSG